MKWHEKHPRHKLIGCYHGKPSEYNTLEKGDSDPIIVQPPEFEYYWKKYTRMLQYGYTWEVSENKRKASALSKRSQTLKKNQAALVASGKDLLAA